MCLAKIRLCNRVEVAKLLQEVVGRRDRSLPSSIDGEPVEIWHLYRTEEREKEQINVGYFPHLQYIRQQIQEVFWIELPLADHLHFLAPGK